MKLLASQDGKAKRRDARVVDALVQATRMTAETLTDDAAMASGVEQMYAYFRSRLPDVLARVKHERREDPEHHTKTLVFRTDVNGGMRDTAFDFAFLSSPEFLELASLPTLPAPATHATRSPGPTPRSCKALARRFERSRKAEAAAAAPPAEVEADGP